MKRLAVGGNRDGIRPITKTAKATSLLPNGLFNIDGSEPHETAERVDRE